MDPGTAILRRYSLFGGLLDDDLDAVRTLLQSEEREAGAVIVREGEHGDLIYFIAQGRVEVRKRSRDGGDVPIATLGTGEAFGEMELVDLQPRSSTVVALEPCSLLTIAVKDLLRLKRERPQVLTILVLNLARDLSRRLRKADALIAERGVPGNEGMGAG